MILSLLLSDGPNVLIRTALYLHRIDSLLLESYSRARAGVKPRPPPADPHAEGVNHAASGPAGPTTMICGDNYTLLNCRQS